MLKGQKLNLNIMDKMNAASIYLAGGCFWGTQAYLKKIRGILETKAGYINSTIKNPTYQDVCSGQTGAAEGVEVRYDATTVDLAKLLEAYLATVDPTSVNRQGNDRGTQYRTGIYYTTDSQRETALHVIDLEQRKHRLPVAVEVLRLKNFYPAEEYHQDYLDKTPGGYCHISPEAMHAAKHISVLKGGARTKAEDADTNYQYALDENIPGGNHRKGGRF